MPGFVVYFCFTTFAWPGGQVNGPAGVARGQAPNGGNFGTFAGRRAFLGPRPPFYLVGLASEPLL